jgi:hypothetical protein
LEDERNGRGMGPIEIFGVRQTIDFGAANIFGAAAVNHITEIGEISAPVVVAGYASRTLTASDARSENYLLADVNCADLGTNLGDLTGDVAARNMGKRNGNAWKTAADPEIKVIEGTGMNADENFVVPEVRLGNIGIVKNRRITVLMEHDRFHGDLLEQGEGASTAGRYIVSRYVGGTCTSILETTLRPRKSSVQTTCGIR